MQGFPESSFLLLLFFFRPLRNFFIGPRMPANVANCAAIKPPKGAYQIVRTPRRLRAIEDSAHLKEQSDEPPCTDTRTYYTLPHCIFAMHHQKRNIRGLRSSANSGFIKRGLYFGAAK